MAVIFLSNGAVEGPMEEVIDMPSVRPIAHAQCEAAENQPVEEVTHMLAVADARKGRVLPAQAVPAVQRHGRNEARLTGRKSQRRRGGAAIFEGHVSPSR